MSSRLLEERLEREQAEEVASAIGISIDDLNQLEWELRPHESDDGVQYGNFVYFLTGSDPEILKKISGLTNNEWVMIGPLSDGDGSDEYEPD